MATVSRRCHLLTDACGPHRCWELHIVGVSWGCRAESHPLAVLTTEMLSQLWRLKPEIVVSQGPLLGAQREGLSQASPPFRGCHQPLASWAWRGIAHVCLRVHTACSLSVSTCPLLTGTPVRLGPLVTSKFITSAGHRHWSQAFHIFWGHDSTRNRHIIIKIQQCQQQLVRP